MMSWIGSLAGRAENFLNLVDQAAGQALQRDPGDHVAFPIHWNSQHERFEGGFATALYPGQTCTLSQSRQITFSASVPIDLNRLNEGSVQSTQSFQHASSPNRLPTSAAERHAHTITSTTKDVKDKDEELFKFLNSPDTSLTVSCKTSSLNKHLGTSAKTSPDKDSSGHELASGLQQHSQSVASDVSAPDVTKNSVAALRTEADVAEPLPETSESNDSFIEKENKALKRGIAALTQELNSVNKRSIAAQEELQTVHHQLSDKSRNVINTEELHARLADMQEALGTKDTQLAILKVRLEEVTQELECSRRSVDLLQAETHRLLRDQPSTAGNGNLPYESLEAKLAEVELQLKKEQTIRHKMQEDLMEKLNLLEVDKQNLCSEVGRIQRFYEEEKGRTNELQSQLKVAKSLADAAKQDLSDYKEKAMRILQSKERLITSLKDGSASNLSSSEQMVSSTEIEAVRQERDMIRDELHHARMALETAKLEITELEMQLQEEQDHLHKHILSMEEQVVIEKKRMQDIEEETIGYKQEISKLQGELQKQTSALLSRIDDRDEEIHRLRNQVTMKSLSGSSQEELENRLHSLTESLIQKQTILESLSTEKNSLVLQLERMEKHYREAEAEAFRASAALTGAQDHQEARHRLPGLLRESPSDGEIARQVKQAANVLDKFSIRLGLFLRRYPIARVFVILYMALLHLWVFIVLMTYQQEIHKSLQPLKPPSGQ